MIDPITGNILKEIKLKPQLFAEGATIVDGLMYVLTWKNKLMLIIDVEQWQIIEEIPMSFTPSVRNTYYMLVPNTTIASHVARSKHCIEYSIT